MRVCPQCNGKQYVIENNQSVQTYLGSNVFTTPTQHVAKACNYCNSTGTDMGAGT
jgi:hypothetical protein